MDDPLPFQPDRSPSIFDIDDPLPDETPIATAAPIRQSITRKRGDRHWALPLPESRWPKPTTIVPAKRAQPTSAPREMPEPTPAREPTPEPTPAREPTPDAGAQADNASTVTGSAVTNTRFTSLLASTQEG